MPSPFPKTPRAKVAKSILEMFLVRMCSLNSIRQLNESRKLRRFLGAPLPSADTLGRVCSQINSDIIRAVNHSIYERLKRNKAPFQFSDRAQ